MTNASAGFSAKVTEGELLSHEVGMKLNHNRHDMMSSKLRMSVAVRLNGKNSPKTSRFDLQPSLHVVGVVKRNDVELQTVANILRSPPDTPGENIPTGSFEAITLQIESELLAKLVKMMNGNVKFGEVDVSTLVGLSHSCRSDDPMP